MVHLNGKPERLFMFINIEIFCLLLSVKSWFSTMDGVERVSRKALACAICDENVFYYSRQDFLQHILTHIGDRQPGRRGARVVCNYCQRTYRDYAGHFVKFHSRVSHACVYCDEKFRTRLAVMNHVRDNHGLPRDSDFHEIESAFFRRIQTFSLAFIPRTVLSVEEALDRCEDDIFALLKRQLAVKQLIQYAVVCNGFYRKENELGEVADRIPLVLRAGRKKDNQIYMATTDAQIRLQLRRIQQQLIEANERLEISGSQWILDHINSINVEVGQLTFRVGCNGLRLVSKLAKSKRAFVTNVSSENEQCMFYAVALGLCGAEALKMSEKQRHLLAKQTVRTRLKTKGFSTPFNLKELHKFETKHKHLDLAINVFTFSDYDFLPVYKSRYRDKLHQINLLLIRGNKEKHHFVLINDLDRLSRDPRRGQPVEYHCFECLTSFTRVEALRSHKKECGLAGQQSIICPQPGSTVSFDSYDKKVPQPIFGVLDFESSLYPVSNIENAIKYNCVACASDDPGDHCEHGTHDVHHQIPTTYSMVFVDMDGKILFQKTE